MGCEECEYFDEHPFVREADYNDYCLKTGNVITDIHCYCDYFKEETL